MAGAIGVKLGGPSTYEGVIVQKPFIGDDEVADYRLAATQTLAIAVIASILAVSLSVAVLLTLRYL